MLSAEEYQDFRNRMQALEDPELLRIALLNRDEYKPESLAIADEEVRKRNLQNVTLDEFSKKYPNEYYPYVPAFCPTCLAETVDESAGVIFNLFGVGVSLRGRGSECDICGSIVQSKWINFIFPIFRIGKYRVKYLEDPGMDRGKFIAMRLKIKGSEFHS